jgi:hypothetical protein
MTTRGGCRLVYDVMEDPPILLIARPPSEVHNQVIEEEPRLTPEMPYQEFVDWQGNTTQRRVPKPGETVITPRCSGRPFLALGRRGSARPTFDHRPIAFRRGALHFAEPLRRLGRDPELCGSAVRAYFNRTEPCAHDYDRVHDNLKYMTGFP